MGRCNVTQLNTSKRRWLQDTAGDITDTGIIHVVENVYFNFINTIEYLTILQPVSKSE